MKMYKGIDVSYHQSYIDWEKVKPQIDFAIIRAGFGNAVDKQFERNAEECTRLGIPFGLYWFSYSYTEKHAEEEARLLIKQAQKFTPTYPLFFDWEYDSYNWAYKNGVKVDAGLMCNMAIAFLSVIESAGYYAANYTNVDFWGRGFKTLSERFDTWLAQWNVDVPKIKCGVWQHSSTGKIDGIKTNVDLDIAYKDYPAIITEMFPVTVPSPFDKEKEIKKVHEDYANTYTSIAEQIIKGEWGNGDERRYKLHNEGIDVDYAQSIVNIMVK